MKNKSNPKWDRIATVIKYSGETSIHGFSNRLGLRRAENLYQIKKGNHGISINLAKTINAIFPEFSVAWLMLGEQDNPGNKGIYFHDNPVDLELKFKEIETGLDFLPDLTVPATGIIKIRSCLYKGKS